MRALIVSMALLVTVVAGEARGASVDLSYRIWFGGLELAEIDAGSEVVDDRYSVISFARSVGVLGLIYDFETRSIARGQLVEGALVPLTFESEVDFGGDQRTLRMTRDSAGLPQVEADPPQNPADRDPVPTELQRETIDPLTGMLSASLGWSDDQVCTGTLPVYNGRTRTDISFEPIGPVTIPDSDYSAYTGEARLCTVRWRVIAGAYKRKWAGLGKTFPDAKLWVARVGTDRHWVPVRLEADAIIAPVVVHLVGLNGHDKKIIDGAR